MEDNPYQPNPRGSGLRNRGEEIENWKREYAGKGKPYLLGIKSQYSERDPRRIACEDLLREIEIEANNLKPVVADLSKQFVRVVADVATIRDVASRPYYRTWGFWLSVGAVAIATLAWLFPRSPAGANTKTSYQPPPVAPLFALSNSPLSAYTQSNALQGTNSIATNKLSQTLTNK